jgi:hypothetical protein
MSVYTVHEPPLRAGESSADPDRFAFVRDGFHVWAFLLTPFWMLWYGLWIVLVIYLAVVAAVDGAALAAGASGAAVFAVGALISLLAGFEASTLRRWTLARRGFRNVGVVIGDDVEAAERRFFDSWSGSDTASSSFPPPAPPAAAPGPRMPQAPEVIGLFPQPGGQR